MRQVNRRVIKSRSSPFLVRFLTPSDMLIGPPLAGHMMQFTSLAFLKAQEKLCGPIPVFYFGLKFKYLDLRLLSAKWWRIIAISRFLIQFAFSSYTWFFVLAFSIISTLILSIPSLPEIWGASAAIPNAPVIFYALTIFLIIPTCILRFVLAEYLAKHHRKLEDTSQFRHPICQSVLVSDEPLQGYGSIKSIDFPLHMILPFHLFKMSSLLTFTVIGCFFESLFKIWRQKPNMVVVLATISPHRGCGRSP